MWRKWLNDLIKLCSRCLVSLQVFHTVLSLYPWKSWALQWQQLTPGCVCLENWEIQELDRSRRIHKRFFSRSVYTPQHWFQNTHIQPERETCKDDPTGVCVLFTLVQEPGQAEHSAAGAGELRFAGQVSDWLCDGVQRDHRTHLQVRFSL